MFGSVAPFRMRARVIIVQASIAAWSTLAPAAAQPLSHVIAQAYTTSPRLEAERARLKATDEDIARALAGYRPTVRAVFDFGRTRDHYEPASTYSGITNPKGYRLVLSQTVFDGLRASSSVSAAEARVQAAREMLRATETQVLNDAVAAYVSVARDTAVADLRSQHVRILEQDVAATRHQHRIGDKTVTDVALAESRLAAARGALDSATVGLHASKAALRRILGVSPEKVQEPGVPRDVMPGSIEEAIAIAMVENPVLSATSHRERAARFDIDIARSEFLPRFTIDATTRSRTEENVRTDKHTESSITGSIVVPLYSGGAESAGLRASKQQRIGRSQDIEQARQDVEASVIAAWSRWLGTQSRRKSDQVQLTSALAALKGMREEEKTGMRSSLDVLNAQQEVVTAQVGLVTTRAEIVTAAYALLAAIGRFNPERLADVAAYDPTVNTDLIRSLVYGEPTAAQAARADTAARPGWRELLRLTTASVETSDPVHSEDEPRGRLLQWLGSALAGASPR